MKERAPFDLVRYWPPVLIGHLTDSVLSIGAEDSDSDQHQGVCHGNHLETGRLKKGKLVGLSRRWARPRLRQQSSGLLTLMSLEYRKSAS